MKEIPREIWGSLQDHHAVCEIRGGARSLPSHCLHGLRFTACSIRGYRNRYRGRGRFNTSSMVAEMLQVPWFAVTIIRGTLSPRKEAISRWGFWKNMKILKLKCPIKKQGGGARSQAVLTIFFRISQMKIASSIAGIGLLVLILFPLHSQQESTQIISSS